MFAAGLQSQEGDEGASAAIQSGPKIANPHDDYGFHVSKQISRQLHKLNDKLHCGGSEPPDYGVDWNSLYAFNTSTRFGRPPEGSVDVALGLFRQARSQAPVKLGQPESASSEEAIDILEMIIEACCLSFPPMVQFDENNRFVKKYTKSKKLRKVSRTPLNRGTKV